MSTQATMRERQLNVRLSEEESDRLAALEQHYGLNGANLVRMWIKREHDAVIAPAKTTRGKR